MNFAYITGVHDDGVTLRFDDGSESAKHYKCNASIVFKIGDRVRIIEDSGTYVVEYPVGSPRTSLDADTAVAAETAASALRHSGTTLAFFSLATPVARRSVPALATGATLAQTITKVNDLMTALRAYNLIGS